jgi:hypothetical protein
MKVVSETSEDDLEKARKEGEIQRTLIDVQTRLTELAANLLRIIRSPSTGGKSEEASHQVISIFEALRKYVDLAGHLPFNHDIENALRIYPIPTEDNLLDEINRWDPVEAAGDRIIDCALQVTASRLPGQTTFISRGMSEFYDGVNSLEDARRGRELEWEAERKERLANGIGDNDVLEAALRSLTPNTKSKSAPEPSKKSAAKGPRTGRSTSRKAD